MVLPPFDGSASAADQDGPLRLFLSYSRSNTYLAHQLQLDLQRSSIDCWIDTKGISAVDPHWRQTIALQIAAAAEVIWLVSPESLESVEVAEERRIALIHQKPIRHLCLVPITSLDASLRSQQQLIDWSCRSRDYRTVLHELLHDYNRAVPLAVNPLNDLLSPTPLDPALQASLPGSASLPHPLSPLPVDLPLQCLWIDVSPYTRSWLIAPADQPIDRCEIPELAIVLRFSGPSDRNTLRDVWEHRRSDGHSPWILYVEGLQDRDGAGYHLPNESGHIWRDSIEAVSRLLHHTAIKRLQIAFYLDAPAVLAMLLGQRLDRDRQLRFYQYVRRTSTYELLASLDQPSADR